MNQDNLKMDLECLRLDSSAIATKFGITDENAVKGIKNLLRTLKQTAINQSEFIPQAIEKLDELWDDAAECWKPFIESAYFELTNSLNSPRNLAEKKISEGLMERPVKEITIEKRETPEIDLTGIFGKKKTQQEHPDKVGGVDASPAALQLAMGNGIDIETVEGTGTGGKITKPDVEAEIERLAGTEVV